MSHLPLTSTQFDFTIHRPDLGGGGLVEVLPEDAQRCSVLISGIGGDPTAIVIGPTPDATQIIMLPGYQLKLLYREFGPLIQEKIYARQLGPNSAVVIYAVRQVE